MTNIWKFILTKMCTSVIGFKLTYLERSLPSPGRCQVGRGDPCISLPFSCGTGCRKVKGSCSTDLGSNKPETKHKTKQDKTKQSKTKQKQNQTKQNKTKHHSLHPHAQPSNDHCRSLHCADPHMLDGNVLLQTGQSMAGPKKERIWAGTG